MKLTASEEQEMEILRHLDDRLPPERLKRLNEVLRGDASARHSLREIADQAVALGDLARTRALRNPSPLAPFPRSGGGWGRRSFVWAAVGVLGLFLALTLGRQVGRHQPDVICLVTVQGVVTWSAPNGVPRTGLKTDDRLPGGTLLVEGEGSSVQFRFSDGTLIHLVGDAELSYSEQHQKRLWLSRGAFSAEVSPQAPGRPMLVRTATAEAEVVGTVFSLSSRPDDTVLNVEEGLVKLRRLSDGNTVEVPALSSAVASVDPSTTLAPAATPSPVDAWTFDFETTAPPRVWRGIWQAPTPEAAGRMVASPYIAGRKGNSQKITHYGISLRTAYLDPALTLQAHEESVFRFRLRCDRPGPLQVMLFTSLPGGGYGGNYEYKTGAKSFHPRDDGWFDFEVPLAAFSPLSPNHPSPSGNILNGVMISSFTKDVALSLARFELSPN